MADMEALTRVEAERNLYLRLLSLNRNDELEPFLNEALELVMGLTDAEVGFLEIFDPDDSSGGQDGRWQLGRACSPEQVASIRKLLSTSVIAKSLATGETISTSSALLDPEFSSRASVQQNAIQAVLCAPIGAPPSGVLYLQGRREPGPFTERDRALAELFARHVWPLARKLVALATAEPLPPLRGTNLLRHEGLVGRSGAFASVLELLAPAAKCDVGVLLTGETGTGKSLLARVIHSNGPRATGPFVEVNCAAITPSLYESEFFGHVRGAFTGAIRERVGRFAAADGGTLFLDEVGEIPLELQSKLLRAVQDGLFERVGDDQTRRVDVRVIAATNTDLEKSVSEGRFRQDLYFRLRVFPVRMPSLRERREDIGLLARHLLARHCARHRIPALELHSAALRAIEGADWPGNIRELDGVLERAAFMAAARGASRLERADVFPDVASGGGADDDPKTLHSATRRFQREFVTEALRQQDWNVTQTAREIGIARSYLYKLIDALEIEAPT